MQASNAATTILTIHYYHRYQDDCIVISLTITEIIIPNHYAIVVGIAPIET